MIRRRVKAAEWLKMVGITIGMDPEDIDLHDNIVNCASLGFKFATENSRNLNNIGAEILQAFGLIE